MTSEEKSSFTQATVWDKASRGRKIFISLDCHNCTLMQFNRCFRESTSKQIKLLSLMFTVSFLCLDPRSLNPRRLASSFLSAVKQQCSRKKKLTCKALDMLDFFCKARASTHACVYSGTHLLVIWLIKARLLKTSLRAENLKTSPHFKRNRGFAREGRNLRPRKTDLFC